MGWLTTFLWSDQSEIIIRLHRLNQNWDCVCQYFCVFLQDIFIMLLAFVVVIAAVYAIFFWVTMKETTVREDDSLWHRWLHLSHKASVIRVRWLLPIMRKFKDVLLVNYRCEHRDDVNFKVVALFFHHFKTVLTNCYVDGTKFTAGEVHRPTGRQHKP